MGAVRRRAAVAVGCLLVLAAAIWAFGRGTATEESRHLVGTQQYLPGLSADVYLPAPARTAPVVVLVPGGAWRTADRSGLAPLADALAGDGMVVVNATYRAADDGVRFPTPVQDIVCAVDFAADRARRAGVTPSGVVLLGHSSGAHLGSLAALAGRQLGGSCPYPATPVDAFVGLAGAYDVSSLADLAEPMLGASPGLRPDLWRQADPVTWVGQRLRPCPLAVLLVHGADDDQVPASFTTAFAAAVEHAGHPVRVVIVPGGDHASIYTPRVSAATIRDWVRSSPWGCPAGTASATRAAPASS